MVNSQFQGAMDDRFYIGLVFDGYLSRRDILPLELVAHAPAGKDRHGQVRPAKASVFHKVRE
jgi:hypothetical protein